MNNIQIDKKERNKNTKEKQATPADKIKYALMRIMQYYDNVFVGVLVPVPIRFKSKKRQFV